MAENPRLVRAKRGIERRIFLKALGLGMAAPFAAKVAKVAVAQQGAAPKRFFLFFMPHGIATEHYNPRVSETDRTSFFLDQTNESILAPLEPLKQYVNIYQGFNYATANTHTGVVNCLSGTTDVSGSGSRTTLEHVIAHGLGVPPLILGACSHLPYGLDTNGMLFWDGTPVDPQKNPAAAADKLFGDGAPAPAVNVDVELREGLLALTATEIQSLQGELTGLTTESTKLAGHLQAIQAIQSEGSGAVSTCTSRPTMPLVEQVRTASAGNVVEPGGGNDYFYQEANFPLLFRAQLELVSQALLCNVAQVIALMPMYVTCDFDFSFAETPGAHHNGLSHTFPQPAQGAGYDSPLSVDNLDPAIRPNFARAQRWFARELVERVVNVLLQDDPAAPGTTVLDNTLIYWMSEIGDGADHTNGYKVVYPQTPSYLPLVSIGRCGGAIQSGQVARFDPARPAGDLYTTLARAMGVTASFPDGSSIVEGVLT